MRRAAAAAAERTLLINAATSIFGERGYHETSMRDIAAQAGFSVGAVYKRFESKDELYYEVVRVHFEAIWGEVDRIAGQALTFMPRMRALTEAVLEHYREHRSFLHRYSVHPPTVAEPYQTRISEMQAERRTARAMAAALREGQQEGLIAAADVEFVSSMYLGMLNRAINDYLTSQLPLPTPDQLLALFYHGAARRQGSTVVVPPTGATSPQRSRRTAKRGATRATGA